MLRPSTSAAASSGARRPRRATVRVPILMLVAASAVGVTAVPVDAQTTRPSADIVDTAVAAGSFTTLAAALTKADLVGTLKGRGPFTVFAPTDAAFAKVPKAQLDALIADKAELTKVLTYHVVAGRVSASQLVRLRSAATVNGAPIRIAVVGGKVVLNGSTNVTATDIAATNGVIHVIDSVLLPPGLALPTPVTSTTAAPTPAPTTTVAPAAKPAVDPPFSARRSVIDVAGTDSRFSTLATAVTLAGLVDTLRSAGPFTVFAPTNTAFNLVDPTTLTQLLTPAGRADMIRTLTYHVVPGRISAAEAIAVARRDGSVRTVQGGELRLSLVNGKLFVNHAEVLIADVDGGNGVIHAIDTVLTPPRA